MQTYDKGTKIQKHSDQSQDAFANKIKSKEKNIKTLFYPKKKFTADFRRDLEGRIHRSL